MWHRAWLRERKLTGGKTYYVCWYGADGRQRQKAIGTDKRLAVELARRKEIELNSGLVGEPQPISFKAFVAEHEQVTEGRVAPATLVSQKEALEVLEELAEPERLTDIDGRAVERFVAARCRAVRPATVNKEIRTLRAIFKKAIKRGYLDKNPFDGVEKFREPERSIRILSLDEIDKLLAAAPSLCWKTFVYLALITGMRRGDFTHLEWDDIDLAGGVLTVQNKAGWRKTKSGKIRHLALTEQAVRLLKELRAETKGRLVLQDSEGRPLASSIHRAFLALVAAAGIKHCPVPADFRRTFVSYLAMAGTNEAIVQRLAGHASIATTLKHYTHILPESLRQAQRSLPYVHAGGMLADSVRGKMQPATNSS